MAGFRKTTLWVREDLLSKGKVLASVRGTTFSDILNTALEEYIRKHEDEIRTKVSEMLSS